MERADRGEGFIVGNGRLVGYHIVGDTDGGVRDERPRFFALLRMTYKL